MAGNEELVLAALSAAGNAERKIPGAVSDWLEENVDPETGYVLDSSLTVAGAAADAKATGDAVGEMKSAINNNAISENLIGNEIGVLYPVSINQGEKLTCSISEGVFNTDGSTSQGFYAMAADGKTVVTYYSLANGESYSTVTVNYNTVKYIMLRSIPTHPLMLVKGDTPATYTPYFGTAALNYAELGNKLDEPVIGTIDMTFADTHEITDLLVGSTVTGYLSANGRRIDNSAYRIDRFAVDGMEKIYLKAVGVSAITAMFTSSATLKGGENSGAPASNILQAINGNINAVVDVPSGAAYIFVCSLTGDTNTKVASVTSRVSPLESRTDIAEAKINDIDFDRNAVEDANYLGYQMTAITPSTTVLSGYLTTTGSYVNWGSYQDYVIKRYPVVAKRMVYIKAIDSVPQGRFFFTSEPRIANNGETNPKAVGEFVNTSYDGLYTVPENAAFVYICELATNSQNECKELDAESITGFPTQEGSLIEKLSADIDSNTICFACVTDQHYSIVLRRGIPQLDYARRFVRLAEKAGAEFMVCLGDMIDDPASYGAANDPTVNRDEIADIMGIYHDSYLPYVYAVGHHEMYALLTTGGDNAENEWSYPLSSLLGQTGRFMRNLSPVYDTIRDNFYFDYRGVRFISLDSCSYSATGFNRRTINFLSSALSDAQNVVVFSHVPTRKELYYLDGNMLNGSEVEQLLAAFNATEGKRVLGYICGHTHWDAIWDGAGFPEIIQCCQTINTHTDISSTYLGNPQNYDRVIGAYCGFCIDFYCIHTDTGAVKIIRFGCGEDREYPLT